jgi:hypothetical protein
MQFKVDPTIAIEAEVGQGYFMWQNNPTMLNR